MIPDEQLDFAACVSSGQVFRFRLEGDVWRGVDGGNLIEARQVPGGWEVTSAPDENAWKSFVQIEVDLLATQDELVEREPRLAPIIARMPGLRTLRPAWAHETLVSFLCTPNNHMSRIVKMAEYLACKGYPVTEGHFAFPSLEVIAEVEESELRTNGFGYRAKSIPFAAAEILRRGEGWLENLKIESYNDAREQIMSVPGIGPKLADCICLFGLHFDDSVPIDTHVWKVCTDWYLPVEHGKPITRQRYEKARSCFAQTFGNLSGWAQQYVFYDQFLSYRRKKSYQDAD